MTFRGARRPAGGRFPLLVTSGVVMLALSTFTACGGSAPDRPAASDSPVAGHAASGLGVDVTFDLTHGVPSDWESQRATVEPGAGGSSWSVRLDANGVPAFVSVPPTALPSGMHHYEFSGRFRVRSRASDQTVGLATVANSAAAHHADLFVDRTSGRCRVDLFQNDSAMSADRCDDGAWHGVTMTGTFAAPTYTLAWTLDGKRMPAIRSTGQPPATVHRIWLGDATAHKTNVTDWTDVNLDLRTS